MSIYNHNYKIVNSERLSVYCQIQKKTKIFTFKNLKPRNKFGIFYNND